MYDYYAPFYHELLISGLPFPEPYPYWHRADWERRAGWRYLPPESGWYQRWQYKGGRTVQELAAYPSPGPTRPGPRVSAPGCGQGHIASR